MSDYRGDDRATLRRFYRAARAVAEGRSLDDAARRAGISTQRLLELDRERNLFVREYETRPSGRSVFSRWGVHATAHFPLLTDDGQFYESVYLDALNASIVGYYWAAVEWAHEKGEPERIRSLEGVVVYDVHGNEYRLETDINRLFRFVAGQDRKEREAFRRLFGSERVALRRGR